MTQPKLVSAFIIHTSLACQLLLNVTNVSDWKMVLHIISLRLLDIDKTRFPVSTLDNHRLKFAKYDCCYYNMTQTSKRFIHSKLI